MLTTEANDALESGVTRFDLNRHQAKHTPGS
jgi:hypothetical protein